MVISIVTYIVFLALILWGGKLPHKNENGKLQLHEDSMSLEVTKSLRGIAAIGVILHHISQESAFQQANGFGRPGVLSIFVNSGFFFVAIFFFCSGFGLIKSLNTKPDYFKGFLKNRIVKTLIIPFYINILLYALFHVISGTKMTLDHWIFNFTGLTLMNEFAWFPIVLTILYLAFYLIFKHVKNRKLSFILIGLVIILQGVFFCISGHRAWWTGPKNWWLSPAAFTPKWWMEEKIFWFSGEWWVNSSITFLLGMIFAENEEKIRNWFQKCYILKLILVILGFTVFHTLSGVCQMIFGYWSEWNGQGPGITNKFICYAAQIPEVIFFMILIFAIMMFFHSENPVSKFFGKISFETYMMNLIAISALRFLIYKYIPHTPQPIILKSNWRLALYEVSVIAVTVLLGLLFKWITKKVNKLLFKE